MEGKQPSIKVELDIVDKVLELIGFAALVALIGLPFYYYGQLPENIPRHYGINGEPDAFSGKAILWTLPAIGVPMFTGLFFLSRKPQWFNYPEEITPENAAQMYKSGAKLVRLLNNVIAVAFAYMTFSTIKTVLGTQSGLGVWFTPVFLSAIFLPIGFYLFYSVRKSKVINK